MLQLKTLRLKDEGPRPRLRPKELGVEAQHRTQSPCLCFPVMLCCLQRVINDRNENTLTKAQPAFIGFHGSASEPNQRKTACGCARHQLAHPPTSLASWEQRVNLWARTGVPKRQRLGVGCGLSAG